jgi:hypothetical protein
MPEEHFGDNLQGDPIRAGMGRRVMGQGSGGAGVMEQGSGLAMLHSCPLASEVFDSPDCPADARIMNSGTVNRIGPG